MDRKILLRYAVRETMGLVVLGAALFWPAGTLDWWAGWAAVLVTAAWILATAVVILRCSPGLMAERLKPHPDAMKWDQALLAALGILELGRSIVAGFDHRLGWSGTFPPGVQIGALLLCILGYGLFVWATASNAFFSQVVRIQAERGQTVVRGGPYHWVRHPGYSGAILFELAIPFLLASNRALILSLIAAGLLVLRTALEDRALQKGLAGYPEYTRQVRYRLIPGVW